MLDGSLCLLAAEGVSINWFEVLFMMGGPIGYLLWTLSVVMVGLIIQACLAVRRVTILPPLVVDEIRTMFDNKQYKEAIEVTSQQPDMLSSIVNAAMAEAPRGFPAMEKAIVEEAEFRKGKMMRALEYLNMLGNIGPLLGLLGTVLGMILAFFTLAQTTGGADPKMLANALGMKLVCTFIGLIVAIPSLTAYGVVRNRIDGLTAEAISTAHDLVGAFRPGGKPATATPTAAPAGATA